MHFTHVNHALQLASTPLFALAMTSFSSNAMVGTLWWVMCCFFLLLWSTLGCATSSKTFQLRTSIICCGPMYGTGRNAILSMLLAVDNFHNGTNNTAGAVEWSFFGFFIVLLLVPNIWMCLMNGRQGAPPLFMLSRECPWEDRPREYRCMLKSLPGLLAIGCAWCLFLPVYMLVVGNEPLTNETIGFSNWTSESFSALLNKWYLVFFCEIGSSMFFACVCMVGPWFFQIQRAQEAKSEPLLDGAYFTTTWTLDARGRCSAMSCFVLGGIMAMGATVCSMLQTGALEVVDGVWIQSLVFIVSIFGCTSLIGSIIFIPMVVCQFILNPNYRAHITFEPVL